MTNSWKNIKDGDIIDLRKIVIKQQFTKPPSRYSQASLIKKLEELGIGRPSTYATIISTLQDRQYVQDSKNQMRPTVLGMQVNKLLTDNFTSVTSSELTAEIENHLDAISRNETTYEEVISNFWGTFIKQIEDSKESIVINRDKYKNSKTSEKCPTCSSEMIIKIGRFGEYFQCEHESTHQFALNYKEHAIELEKAISEYSELTKGLKCSECEKDLIVRVSKSSLKAYIACPEYRVGNKHNVLSISKILNPNEVAKKSNFKFKKKSAFKKTKK